MSVASHPRRGGKATRFWPAGQNRGVASGEHKIGKTSNVAKRGGKEQGETPRTARGQRSARFATAKGSDGALEFSKREWNHAFLASAIFGRMLFAIASFVNREKKRTESLRYRGFCGLHADVASALACLLSQKCDRTR